MLNTSRCEEELMRAREFADIRGIRDHFEERLEYLGKLFSKTGDGSDVVCNLHTMFGGEKGRDFEFFVHRKLEAGETLDYRKHRLINGGLVFHEFENGKKGGWGVHT